MNLTLNLIRATRASNSITKPRRDLPSPFIRLRSTRRDGFMAPKVMLFAGAPAPSTVNEASCTITNLDPRLEGFLGLNALSHTGSRSQEGDDKPSQSLRYAPWRAISLKTHAPLSFSQTHQVDNSATAFDGNYFFTTADVSGLSEDVTRSFQEAEEILSQFCEQSLAAHNPVPSSQLEGETTYPSFTSLEETSFLSTISATKSEVTPRELGVAGHLSDLEDIPPPKDILAAIPSTITVNLIVGIISIAQPRTVTTRWGRQLSLVEVLVGDETRSGFAVTFWLSSDSVSASTISKLRRQDVVLLRNVALHVFRNKIYGQSLRKGLTQINLLWRRDGSGYYSTRQLSKGRQGNPQMEKTRRTKDWVLHFVGADGRSEAGRKRPRKSWDQPPDDTQ